MAYTDFKSYIQEKYGCVLQKAIAEFVNEMHDGRGFHSINVLPLCKQKIENIKVKSLRCHSDVYPLIKIEINLVADIVMMGLGIKNYQADCKQHWFTVTVQARLKNGLHDMTILDVGEYYGGTFDKEDALDEYLIPYIYAEDLENIADDFTEFYCQDAIYDGWKMPIQHVLEEMNIEYYNADLPSDEFGRMYFKPAVEVVEERHFYPRMYDFTKSVSKKLRPGTMLISKNHSFMGSVGSHCNTIAHEIIHWELHQNFFEILSLLNQDALKMSCKVTPNIYPDTLQGVEKAVWWAEWQANALAPRILMPRILFDVIFPKIISEKMRTPHFTLGNVMEDALIAVADCFDVSRYEAKLRALQRGYKCAEGCFLHVDGRYIPPYAFDPNALGDYQTFLMDEKNFERLYENYESFAALFESGAFVYLGYLVCINDEKYVKSLGANKGYELTQYGLDHVDECCLKFNRRYELNKSFGDYYNMCYLCQNINAAAFSETRDIDDEDMQDKKEQAAERHKLKEEGIRVTKILRGLPSSFSGTLDAHMKRLDAYNPKTGRQGKFTNMILANRTGLSEDYISQLRNDVTRVSLETVCALCIGMHLHPILSMDLIKKSKNDFPDDDEGFFDQYLIQHHFMDTLLFCNQQLKAEGYRTWGKLIA